MSILKHLSPLIVILLVRFVDPLDFAYNVTCHPCDSLPRPWLHWRLAPPLLTGPAPHLAVTLSPDHFVSGGDE